MIITLIFACLILIGIIDIVIVTSTYNDALELLGIIIASVGFVVGISGLLCCIAGISAAHIGVDKQYHDIQVRHDNLTAQVKVINSDYEDISKTKAIQDVTDWNLTVYSAQYWERNPWTNWFYCEEVVDAYEYIEMEDD